MDYAIVVDVFFEAVIAMDVFGVFGDWEAAQPSGKCITSSLIFIPHRSTNFLPTTSRRRGNTMWISMCLVRLVPRGLNAIAAENNKQTEQVHGIDPSLKPPRLCC